MWRTPSRASPEGRGLGGPDVFAAYYEDAQANGYADVTTPWGQVQSTSLQWFEETLAADPAGDIESFSGPVLVPWAEMDQVIPYGEVEAYMAATDGSTSSTELVTIPEADHGYGFYSEQPEVDAILHESLVDFFSKALAPAEG